MLLKSSIEPKLLAMLETQPPSPNLVWPHDAVKMLTYHLISLKFTTNPPRRYSLP